MMQVKQSGTYIIYLSMTVYNIQINFVTDENDLISRHSEFIARHAILLYLKLYSNF